MDEMYLNQMLLQNEFKTDNTLTHPRRPLKSITFPSQPLSCRMMRVYLVVSCNLAPGATWLIVDKERLWSVQKRGMERKVGG